MFSVSVFSASSDLSFHLGFRNNWTFGRPSASLSQESSNLEPRKKEVTARSATKDKILLSSSPTTSQQQNPTPLVTALKASAEQNAATFHFPGHNRGRAAPDSITELIGLNPFLHDLPELPELDSLFSPEGPILDAQQQAAKLFGSLETWFLVGGTTCGIQAAIMATCSPGDILVLARNSHISAVSALILSGAVPKYIIPDYNFDWDIAVGVTPSQVETAIKEVEKEGEKAAAVFITSPTYHGICSNLSEITQLCHSHGIPVIVDEAHGAHLGFHPHMPNSAMQQGADLAVQSTHKVLCSLTQSSMLHLSGFRQLGLSGYEADEILYEDHDIICELVETQCITFVITLGTCREHVQKLVSGIKHLAATSASTCADKRKADGDNLALFADIKTSLIPRDAFFSGKRRVSIEKSLGEVCGELICPYPPGIPVLIPGEIITKKALDYLLHVRSKGAVITGASDSQLSSIIVCNK
ncbi:uncharacterized protein LOC133709886 isoform X2 [Rosa rugosa]|uniref:uncharacterized protein LOC133709886 isoform X2 n=1 Tax=Rosa rugosa TaxID=74645 RepID=UPI002B404AD4|nr:uncharacterized protein LOC133709886 isoform X2 [Rosa rugosa]